MRSSSEGTVAGPAATRGGTGGAASPVLLNVTSVRKSFGAVHALREASLHVTPGEVLGICGHNGAGKSTLVKLLTGVLQPDAGTIEVNGRPVEFNGAQDAQRHGIAHVDQELTIIPALSVRDNLELGDVRTPLLRRRTDRARLGRLLDVVGLGHIDPRRSAGSLSLGERQLLEIARGLSRQCRVLLLDEPTATLTRIEIKRVFEAVEKLREQGAGVLFISHRLDEVFDLCDRVTVMRDGAVVATHSIDELDRPSLVELILGEQGGAASGPVGKGPHPAAACRAGLQTPNESARPAPVLTVEAFTTSGTAQPVSLAVPAGRIVGLAGQLGSGNAAVLEALGGLDPAATGTVTVRGRRLGLGSPNRAARAGIAFVSGDRKRSGLYMTRTIGENLVATRMPRIGTAGVLTGRRLRLHAHDLAETVGVDARRLAAHAEDLSGGNQQKVLVGRGLALARTAVMLLEEPTRGVDIGGRADIHRLIGQFAADGGGVVFASTELSELLELADDVVVFREGRIVAQRPSQEWTEHELLTAMTSDTTGGRTDTRSPAGDGAGSDEGTEQT